MRTEKPVHGLKVSELSFETKKEVLGFTTEDFCIYFKELVKERK